ncbi:hypothetical protein HZB03_00575 [Candidatus Woesearchaeota archaeon]|nr:hypothetical protein [Candidatus Woesearchaeota archaeon]
MNTLKLNTKPSALRKYGRPDVFRKRLGEGFTKVAAGTGPFVDARRIARIWAFYHPQGRVVTMELPELLCSSETRYCAPFFSHETRHGVPFIEEYDSVEFQEYKRDHRILLAEPRSLEQVVSEDLGHVPEPSNVGRYPSIVLADKLEQEGYAVADASGKPTPWPDHDLVEVLQPQSVEFLGIEFFLKAHIVGRYYLNNEDLRAQCDSRWVLEVYGRANMLKLQRIGREVGYSYGVPCKMNVVNDAALKSKHRVKAKKK